MYAVVIGDIVRSRDSSDRKALQSRLVDVVARVNQRTDPRSIVSPYTITLGDEVQSVYSTATTSVLDILAFRAWIQPVEMRFCIGLGEIATRINRKAAIGMDGPAFHAARAGIEALKEAGDAVFAVNAQPGIDVDLEDSAVKLVELTTRGWRPVRFAVFSAALRGETNTKAVAAGLHISRAAVYKNRSEGHVKLLITTAGAIGRSLTRKIRPPRRQLR